MSLHLFFTEDDVNRWSRWTGSCIVLWLSCKFHCRVYSSLVFFMRRCMSLPFHIERCFGLLSCHEGSPQQTALHVWSGRVTRQMLLLTPPQWGFVSPARIEPEMLKNTKLCILVHFICLDIYSVIFKGVQTNIVSQCHSKNGCLEGILGNI